MKNILILSLLFLLVAASCKKKKIIDPVDTPPTQNEEELITTVRLIFADSAGVLPNQTFQFQDVDGAGGAVPTIFDTIRLSLNTTFFMRIELLNESVNPVINLTPEVLAEAKDHLFCFTPLGLTGVSIVRTDSDGSFEIGLQSKWKSTGTTSGKVRVVLKHQPGVKNGNCNPGDTDVELEFELRVD